MTVLAVPRSIAMSPVAARADRGRQRDRRAFPPSRGTRLGSQTRPGGARRERAFSARAQAQDFAAALPPLRPAAFFCCEVPPCFDELLLEPPLPDFLPPREEEPSELAIAAARPLLMPFFLSPSYCLSFFTLGP